MSRIYVASLLDYNCGTLHGAWFDVDGMDATSLGAEIQFMLDKSPHMANGDGIAEEFAIHDFEGFGGADIGEYTSLEFVVRLAELVEEHGAPFAVFIDNIWTRHVDTVDELDPIEAEFRDAWIGNMSAEDYAQGFLDEREDIPEDIRQYVDVERFARDMKLSGQITEYYEDMTHYLFRSN